MLFDEIFQNMMNAIPPSRAKLESNRFKSVESCITTLKSLLPDLTIDVLDKVLTDTLTDSCLVLDEKAVSEIEQIEQSYYRPEWLERGRRVPTVRVKNVGEIALVADCDSNVFI